MTIIGKSISLLLLLISTMLVGTHCQALAATLRPYSSVYVIKFFKATSAELDGLGKEKNVLTEIQFLEKLVRNTADVLTQAVFYVNFTIQAPVANFSNVAENKYGNNGTAMSPDAGGSRPNSTTNSTSGTSMTTGDGTNAGTTSSPPRGSPDVGASTPPPSTNTTKTQPQVPVQVPATIPIPTSTQNVTTKPQTQPQNLSTPTQPILPNNGTKNQSLPGDIAVGSVGPGGSSSGNLKGGSGSGNSSVVLPPTLPPASQSTPQPSPPAINSFSIYKNSSSKLLATIRSTPPPPKPFQSHLPINTQFPGIALYHEIALNFTRNETYKFAGIVTNPSLIFDNGTTSFNFVNVIFGAVQGEEKIKCIERVSRRKVEFQISCRIKVSGVFYLSIFVGGSGYSSKDLRRVYDIPRVLPAMSGLSPQPQTLYLSILQGNLFINWNTPSTLSLLTFHQSNNSLQYILSNNHTKFRVPHSNFLNFEQDLITVTLRHATSRDSSLFGINSLFGDMLAYQFMATQHLHVGSQEEGVDFWPGLPVQMRVNQEVTLTGVFTLAAQNQYYLVSPFNQIKKKLLDPKLKSVNDSIPVIKPGTNITLKLNFPSQGPNLLQINQDSGLAIINQPIYVGNIYPLVPDYLDLKIQALLDQSDPTAILESYIKATYPRTGNIRQPNPASSLEQKRNYLLNLLNMLRMREIVNPVYLDARLTAIAQEHSDDMAANNYFSHSNLDGQGPGQRAKRFGFNGAIGENVAQSSSLIEAHLSLQRSAAHFENSISKIWTRVGIGINTNAFNQYLVTFQFSSRDIQLEPLTKSQLETHQTQLIQMLKRKFPTIKQQNKQVSSLILEWILSNRTIPLTQYIISKGVKQLMTNNSVKFTYYPDFVAEIEKSENVFGNVTRFNQVGVNLGISRTEATLMECYFVFLLV